MVLLGTVFPLLVEELTNRKISVGAPYFNRMVGPIVIALLFLMGIAPVLPWRKASIETMRHRLVWSAWGGGLTVVVAVALGATGFAPLLIFGLGGFVAGVRHPPDRAGHAGGRAGGASWAAPTAA